MRNGIKKRRCPSFLKGPRRNFPSFLFSQEVFNELDPLLHHICIVLYFHILRDPHPQRPLKPALIFKKYKIPRSTLWKGIAKLEKKGYIITRKISDKTWYTLRFDRFIDDLSNYGNEAIKHAWELDYTVSVRDTFVSVRDT